MKKEWSPERIVEGISYVLMLVFLYAGISLLLAQEKFTTAIRHIPFPLLADLAGLIAWLVPIANITVATLLAIPRLRTAGLYTAGSMMAGFMAYIVAVVQLVDPLPPFCTGVLGEVSWNTHLIFNTVCALLALTASLLHAGLKADQKSVISCR